MHTRPKLVRDDAQRFSSPLAGEGSQVHSTCRVGEPLPRRKPKHDIPVLQESHWIPAFAGMTTVGSQETDSVFRAPRGPGMTKEVSPGRKRKIRPPAISP